MNLWSTNDVGAWRKALGSYEARIASREVNRLPQLDRWYREAFPRALRGRTQPFVTKDELIDVAQWKMKRGVYRARNLVLLKKNAEATVRSESREAFGDIPDPRKPISKLCRLSGVGPATASAVLAALRPDLFPFFDDQVAKQVPDMGTLAFTLSYYVWYAEALSSRARALRDLSGAESWTAQDVAQALWAHSSVAEG
jgi:hypothetical protein